MLNKGGWEVMYKGWPNFPASVTAQVQTKRSAAAGGYSGVMFTATLQGRLGFKNKVKTGIVTIK